MKMPEKHVIYIHAFAIYEMYLTWPRMIIPIRERIRGEFR